MPANEPTNKDVSKVIAWILSVGIHLGVGALAFFITWSVIAEDDEPPVVVTATWHEKQVEQQANTSQHQKQKQTTPAKAC